MDNLYLQEIRVKREVPYLEARKMAMLFLRSKRKTFFSISDTLYHFRNIPKTKFKGRTLKECKVSENVSLIYGKLKTKRKADEQMGSTALSSGDSLQRNSDSDLRSTDSFSDSDTD